MSKVYKVTMLMDQDWKDQFETWLEYAEYPYEGEDGYEVCQVLSVEEVDAN